MSGIYIPGMKMPTSCCACPCSYDNQCAVTHEYPTFEEWYESKPKWCPLIPVTEHGDLIDYNFCMENYVLLHEDDGNPVYAVRMRDINNAPAIIPADKEGEG